MRWLARPRLKEPTAVPLAAAVSLHQAYGLTLLNLSRYGEMSNGPNAILRR